MTTATCRTTTGMWTSERARAALAERESLAVTCWDKVCVELARTELALIEAQERAFREALAAKLQRVCDEWDAENPE